MMNVDEDDRAISLRNLEKPGALTKKNEHPKSMRAACFTEQNNEVSVNNSMVTKVAISSNETPRSQEHLCEIRRTSRTNSAQSDRRIYRKQVATVFYSAIFRPIFSFRRATESATESQGH